MNDTNFTFKKSTNYLMFTTALLIILLNVIVVFGQYKGEPVKKDRLLKALRSKQLQTRDIVTIIKSNGVDFKLTPEIIENLVAAGARPAVINVVSENLRLPDSETDSSKSKVINISSPTPYKPTYDALLNRAMFTYKNRRNPKDAVKFLEQAVKLNPKDPTAYQMLGLIYLYELKDTANAQKYMRQSIANGGSAVFRVFHDDGKKFAVRCAGSLYISSADIRFESDDNIHTIETSIAEIEKIMLFRESSKVWKNNTIINLFLNNKTKETLRFAPINGKEEESKIIAQFIENPK